jgi:replicative DNA helicase
MNARNDFSAFDAGMDPEDSAVAQLRVPPHSIESESSVLGALLLDNSAWDRVGDLLTDTDFYRHEHRLIYAAIGTIINASKPADVVTVFEYLQARNKGGEAGGLVYLDSLAQYVSSAANVRRYAEIVRERAILRQMVAAADEIATAAFNTEGKSAAELLDLAEQKIFRIGEQGQSDDDWEGTDTGMVKLLDYIQDHSDGTAKQDFTPLGLPDLDERLDGGARGGELIVLGARPGMGKSALALTIADHIARAEGLPVALFSMEMPAAQVHKRLMAMRARIHLSRIKRPERLKDFDWPGITKAVEELRNVQLHVNDHSGLNINQVRTKARSLARRLGRLGLVVVDYLGLMSGMDPKQPRAYQIEEITKGLKGLAKELRCPVLLLCQINRGVEQRTDQMPILSDLRDSGSIEQDADIVIFLHRAIVTARDLSDEWKHYAKASVAKLRDGDPGFVDLMYIGEHTLFQSWPADMAVPTTRMRGGSSSGGKGL